MAGERSALELAIPLQQRTYRIATAGAGWPLHAAEAIRRTGYRRLHVRVDGLPLVLKRWWHSPSGRRDPGATCPVAVEIAIVYQLHDDRPFLRDCLPRPTSASLVALTILRTSPQLSPRNTALARTFPRLTGGD